MALKRKEESNQKKDSAQKRIEEIKKAKELAKQQMEIDNDKEIENLDKHLRDLCADPTAMLAKIDKQSCGALFPLKDKIGKHQLIEKHRNHFAEFNVLELIHERKLLIPQKGQDGRVMPYNHNYNQKKYKWGQFFKQQSIDVHLGVKNGKAYLFEGNYEGYGRRSWLLDDGSVKHEHGIFEEYTGKLLQKMALLGPQKQ